MAKEKEKNKKSTVIVENIVPAPIVSNSEPRVFVKGKIQINGVIDRKRFNHAFKGKIEVDIEELWSEYQKWLKK